MAATSLQDRSSSAAQSAILPGAAGCVAVPWSAIVMLIAGMAAAWLAAGSTGLLALPLQNALTWLALAVAIVAGWPNRGQPLSDWAMLAGGVVVGIAMTALAEPVVGVMVVALVLAVLARCQPALARQIVLLAALAATVLGIFRLACSSIPTVWLIVDHLGELLGRFAGWMAGRPLRVGATFGGVDFLVLMAVLYAGWLVLSSSPQPAATSSAAGEKSGPLSLWERVRVRALRLGRKSSSLTPALSQREREISSPRLARAIYAAVAILAGHFAYLVVLAYCNDLTAWLPEAVVTPPSDINRVGVWTWAGAARTFLPWNLPLLAAGIQAVIAGVMFRGATWLPAVEADPQAAQQGSKASRPQRPDVKKRSHGRGSGSPRQRMADATSVSGAASKTESSQGLFYFVPVLLAMTAAALTMLAPISVGLKNKTIVAYNQGHFDWVKPEYDRVDPPSKPTFGMLPMLVESLGGRLIKSDDLSERELAEADVLLLVHPDQPWPKERLERIWKYVRNGGSLLVAAGPRVRDGDAQSSFNDVLAPSAVQVRYDTAIAAAAHWEDCYQWLAHPITAGIDPRRNGCGLGRASSLRIHWPVRPLPAGRFAYSTPGSDAAATGRGQYVSGERLGDLVLAAEQPLGRGRIVVLGDASPLSDDGSVAAYTFTGRLLSYLANKSSGPHTWWRQLLGLITLVALAILLGRRPDALRLGVSALALSVAVTCCAASNHSSARVLPDGRGQSPNNIAYIDASHLNAYSSDMWSDHGLGNFARTLTRNGYLPLLTPEVTADRLERAGLLISIAPARRFSLEELGTVQQFVEGGGTLICMVGAEEAVTSRELLRTFEFNIPSSPVPPGDSAREPEPLGAYYSQYLELEGLQPRMRFYAAWPVECTAGNAEVLKYGPEKVPLITHRHVGRGEVVVIGDTYFAVNANMGPTTEEPSENPVFWRWLLSRVCRPPEWLPSKPSEASGPRENDTPIEPDRSEHKQ